MNVTCSAEPCPVILNATCVFYEGETLLYTGITTNDNLQTALQKIDAKFADASIGYAFNNGLIQSAPGQPVQLGGSLIQNTTIGGNYKLAFVGELEASALVTTGGTSSQFVKGDGTLDSTSYQPAGNYISSLVGDGTASGPGAATLTLATVFGAPGTYGNSTTVPRVTVDSKGRVTNVVNTLIALPSDALLFQGDVTGSGFTGSPVTLTLNTVNTDIYGSNNFLKFAVNGKGLITSATPVSNGDITTALGYVPVDDAIELTINGVSHDLSANRSWSVGTVTNVSITAGTGINASISNPNTTPSISITNTAPDQTVVLNGGTGISITGSYPNFTITNDYPSLGGTVTNFSAGNLSPLFTTSVSNSSTTPALSFALSNAAANTVFAGPNGGSGAPTFRALVAADIPSLSYISSISVTSPLASTGGLTPTLSISQADSSTNGYLSSVDWNTFNAKQPAGNYITALTGDATASGPGSACLTFNTVNATTGTFGSSTQVPVITVNGKGLVTCVTTSNISGSLEFIGDVTGTGSTGACTTLTLATVNNDVYASETLLNIAVNGKGLITSANPTTAGDICSTLGYTPENVANKSTCTSLGTSNTLYPTQLAVKTYVDSATSGGIILQGDWNAATNTPDITGTTTTGWAWRVSVSGTTNLGGITDWHVGDLAVKSATGWVKIDNSDGVTSVFGRFGAVVATTGDYLSCQVTECGNLYYTDTRVRAAVGHTAPLTYNSTTGVFGISQSNCTTDGYLSATDWTTFNDKQPALGYTPVNQTRQLTINGTTYDLTADRSWSVGTVTSVTGSAPLASSGGTTPNLTISQSGTASDGYLSSTDWNHFNSHTSCTGTVTNVATCTSTTGVLLSGSPVTTSGTLGVDISTASSVCTGLLTAADWNTFNSHTGCTGTVTSVGLTSATTGVTIGSSPITSSGDITLNIATASSLCTGLLTSSDWNTFNSHTGCTGTVTCVDAIGTNISVTGGPITSSGTLNISLSGANVCSALGYTPYDSSNPNGYTTCTGTVTSVGIVATNINVCCSPVTTSGNICLNLTGANVCAALGYSPSTAPTIFVNGIGTCSVLRCGVSNGASGDYTASLGGQSNLVSGCYSTIVGGQCNNISERRAVIVGGLCNTVSSYGGAVFTGVCNTSSGISASVVVGGSFNTASGYLSIVGGGNRNSATATYSSVFSGCCNTASGNFSTISGGQCNIAFSLGTVIGGGECNCGGGNIFPTVSGGYRNYADSVAVVAGGSHNNACGLHAVIGGGYYNTACGHCSTVSGGKCNTISASGYYGGYSTIGGGLQNSIFAPASFIGGGNYNIICNNPVYPYYGGSTIAGGDCNFVGTSCSNIAGGWMNTIACEDGSAFGNAIGGGVLNKICCTCTGSYNTISGGGNNTISNYLGDSETICSSSISGGYYNVIRDSCATIAGGNFNKICKYGYNSFIGSGSSNTICSSNSSIGGGYYNTICFNSGCSTVSGGYCNTIYANSNGSAIVGGQCNITGVGGQNFIGSGSNNYAGNFASIVVGGSNNYNGGASSFIGGGTDNGIGGWWSSVTGGRCNLITSGGDGMAIVGGLCNKIFGGGYATSIVGGYCNCTSSGYSTIVGGFGNKICGGPYATILGGCCNTASGYSSSVLGGSNNVTNADYSAVFGCGLTNNNACTFMANNFVIGDFVGCGGCSLALDANGKMCIGAGGGGGGGIMVLGTGCNSTIRCGVNNVACGDYSASLSGQYNTACRNYSFAGGGQGNTASGYASFVGGGNNNTASGVYSAIVGGGSNTTSGELSFAGGGYCNTVCGNYSFIGGGCVNTNQGLSSFIGGGDCNTTTPTYTCNIVNFNNITCSNCYGGVVLDASYGDVTACFSSGTALIMCLTDNSTCNTFSTGSSYYAGSTTFYPSVSSYNYCAVDATVETGTKYATIGGGCCNTASAFFSTVGGGSRNSAIGKCSFIGGGECNTVSSNYGSSISGGSFNTICAGAVASTISGGYRNIINSPQSFIGGGSCHCTNGPLSTIAGGLSNNTIGNFSTVSGGYCNSSTCVSVVAGGSRNSACCPHATVSGGFRNTVDSCCSTISGGYSNTISGGYYVQRSTIAGGGCNTICAPNSFKGGGSFNTICNNPVYSNYGGSNIAGGECNFVGVSLSNIAGGWMNTIACEDGLSQGNAIGGGLCNIICCTNSGQGNNISGGCNNIIANGVDCFTTIYASSISGGQGNLIRDSYSTIAGGQGNKICCFGYNSFIGSGGSNQICSGYSSIGSGRCNTICCGSFNSTVSSGYCNTVGGGFSGASCSFIGGGGANEVSSQESSIVGGVGNVIQNSDRSFIGGGNQHYINNSCKVFIGGGDGNYINNSCRIFIGGGVANQTNNSCNSSIVGGSGNSIFSANCSVISGGRNNTIGEIYSTISGGYNNAAYGCYSFIGGGSGNVTSGNYSGAFGCNLNASAACTMYFNNVCVCGTLSKASGSFKIPHPDPIKSEQGKFLKHSFVESPTAGDNIYRFNVTATNCSASIQLPDYYSLLNSNDQVFVNAKSHLGYGFGVVNEAQTEIDITTNSDGEYNVLLIGTRKDKLALDAWNGTEVNDVE